MNLSRICGGLCLALLAWPAFGQEYHEHYFAATMPGLRYPQAQAARSSASPAAYQVASDGGASVPATPGPLTSPSASGVPAAPIVPPAASPSMGAAAVSGDTGCTACTAGGCASGPCGCGSGNSCGGCCNPCSCCCTNMWDHETGIFAEYMYLRPFGANVSYGIQQNGVGGLGTAPAGDVGVISPEFDNGYRLGFEWACSCTSGIRATYTSYQTSTHDSLLQAGGIGGTAASLLLHPGTVDAASTFSEIDAAQAIRFRMADIDYSTLINECDSHAVNFNIGVRYAHLENDFTSAGIFSGAEGEEDVFSTIRFDGVGLRTGLDGQWRLGDSRFSAYGWGFINVLFGEFASRYQQFNATTTTVEAASNWSDDRVVPILDYEVGIRWTSCNGHWQIGSGYYTAFWFNTVTTGDFVRAVQSNDFTHVDKTIAFTGLTTRVEFRF